MALLAIHSNFESDLLEPTRVYEELATSKTFTASTDFTVDELCQLEGVMSRVWQAWCRFCRSLVLESCTGTHDLSGLHIPPLVGAQSEGHVSGAAIYAWRNRGVNWRRSNLLLRLEPTWGDVDVLLDIVTLLSPANAGKLSGMCTLASSEAKFLQAARNAASHDNQQSLNQLIRLSGPFLSFPINHACESLFWVETTSSDYLLPFVLHGLRGAADYAVL
jgi:hypothetical protein